MNIKELMELCIEPHCQLVEIYSIDMGETIFLGLYSDLPIEYEAFEVGSWNTRMDGGVCFNV